MLTTSETFVFRFCSIFNNSPQTESKERPRARKRFNKSTAVRKTILRAKPIQQTEDNGGGGFKFDSHFRFFQTSLQKEYLIKFTLRGGQILFRDTGLPTIWEIQDFLHRQISKF